MPHGFYYGKPYPGSTLPYQGESPLRPAKSSPPSWADAAAVIAGQLARGSGPTGRGFDPGWPSVAPPHDLLKVHGDLCDKLRALYERASATPGGGPIVMATWFRQDNTAPDPREPDLGSRAPKPQFDANSDAGALLLAALGLLCPWAIVEAKKYMYTDGFPAGVQLFLEALV